ncbi:transposase [Streptococcus pneumoniae]|nr:transposase [Streptococcus pneumoniae]
MTVEEEKAFLARHLKAAEAGEFVTIDALFQAYKKELGRSYTRVVSKNKISIKEDKKAL